MGQQVLPPGYRFSPTDEELMMCYLMPKALGGDFYEGTIAEVDVYKFEPWDLPGKSALPSKDSEWYFFSSQDKKYSHTARINRTTMKGYWKATGKDRKVCSGSCIVGSKKTLIYYKGRAPNGSRTNWVMHEYRLDEESEMKKTGASVAVVCRIRKKGGSGPRNGEQYGAPILNEDVGTKEVVNLQKVDVGPDTGCMDAVKCEDGGNIFDLRNQAEVWKHPVQMDLSKVASECIGNEDVSARTITGSPKIIPDCIGIGDVYAMKVNDCEPHKNDIFQSLSDATCFEMASNFCDQNGEAFPCSHQCMVMQDTDFFSNLPTLSDVGGHCLPDYESSNIEDLWELLNDGQGELSGTGANERMMLQAACNVPRGGDGWPIGGNFIELADIETPLDGYAPRSPLHSSEFGWPMDQQLWFNADNRVATCEEVQYSPHSQGLAARRARLQIPVFNGRLMDAGVSQQHKAARTLFPEVEKLIHGGSSDISIPIARERNKSIGRNFAGSCSGSGFNSCDTHHVRESSSRSFLSKHMSAYAVSKCEMVPAQLCYASLTDVQDVSSTDFTVGDESRVDTLENVTTIQRDLSSSLSSGSPTETSNPEGRSPDVEDPLLQGCNSKTESATDGVSPKGHSRWKKPLRGLVNKAKQSTLGTRLLQLESGMRAKFNDKLSALGKPAARLLPTEEGNTTNPYDSLRKIIVATLCHLAAAVLIFFCLFWGVHLLSSHAFSVAV